ncbi:ribonuclease M5 [Selenomonas sp. TAMA-11512]|uniref:ribonuclease M5 n=1 Tax=Selenomonas sp. TAMA-11512 TaxID=3095337 RepID=UPI00308A6606|nr:ribonuclease M5 [Selenomonas sp. TAMA-11512]
MIKEVLVVEGKMDIAAIRKAYPDDPPDCIITGGFTLAKHTLDDIEKASKRRGIIILTDPDGAGERIRKFLAKRFPEAKHAFVPREDATANDDVGIEQASPEAIRSALAKVRTAHIDVKETFQSADMVRWRLSGADSAAERRARLGAALGIGYANAKTFLLRLNHYGVTREEFDEGIRAL